jgi:hypothetical protein
MANFHTNVLDPQIKALPTVGTAQGSVASFETDMTEDLIEVVCDIQYSQASGTPTPINPIPITVYNSLNLSHSGADTSNPTIINIPFGQTVAKGTLNVTTGVLEITHKYIVYNGGVSELWYFSEQSGTGKRRVFTGALSDISPSENDVISNMFSYSSDYATYPDIDKMYINNTPSLLIGVDSSITSASDWKTFLSNNNLQIVVKLATPITIQLSSTQITALLNENNIWHDCNGDTEVKFLL